MQSAVASKPGPQRKMALIFICVPVGPGKSRLIWVFPRNFGVWIDKVVPRWVFHIGQNLILDSDLYLLHVEVSLFLNTIEVLLTIKNANNQCACIWWGAPFNHISTFIWSNPPFFC